MRVFKLSPIGGTLSYGVVFLFYNISFLHLILNVSIEPFSQSRGISLTAVSALSFYFWGIVKSRPNGNRT